MKNILFCLLVGISFTLSAQSSRIKEVNLTANSNNHVLITWILNAGSSCNAPEVQHSLNGIDFKTVYIYPGICGGTTEEESYGWVHTAAKKYAVNYYRIKVNEGEVTLPKRIDLQSILADDKLVVYPLPVGEFLNFELRNENNLKFEVSLIDRQGNLVLTKKELRGRVQKISLPSLKNGLYFLSVSFENGDQIVRRIVLTN